MKVLQKIDNKFLQGLFFMVNQGPFGLSYYSWFMVINVRLSDTWQAETELALYTAPVGPAA